ncbi:DMT superfamily transport protein [Natronomonas moolapensis 8.8.11]|uniref:DMT superfamily transport protein n=1 Tax=Natronomonas moolapensis (strain DSM 18674 / CECT 7526 / JCM 14361 / 8.8.11) TaxID=268739 RepID=M1Y148_NATM8|nr:EamA family transporter [Natronomonas moolapensis]CCQ36204.1 DMT superfamily transport protein [Natronomonas moolapensis 8.8.11]CCQ36216.1 DMT superfamily transport protein [Natronomonas moolapensis 8.8.11]
MRYRNTLLFLTLASVWGSAFMAIKAGLGDPTDPAYFFTAPVLFAAFRFDIAGVLMFGYALYATDRWRPRDRADWATVCVGAALIIAGYHALLFVGERGTTSAAAAVIVSLSPVVTTAFARLLLPEERLTAVGIAGMALGFVGVVVLSRPDPANLVGSRFETLVFAAALCFALGSVLTRRIDAGLPVETMEAWSMLLGAALMHGLSLALGEAVPGAPTGEAVAALAYLAVVSSALGFLIYFHLLERLGAIEINLVSYVAPAFAAVTGLLFLGERIDAPTVVGFAIILAGFSLVKHRSIRTELRQWWKS